ncbi:molybdate transport system ATP-binding protein [Polaromonas sp. YR568]|uniref:ABC transporter ATP-binding protein n=1 Tax=Polaromonas sp. YR568 TaxID=1855301 RepID=UPI0008F0A45C|nr:ATP-binding cassette domain-containing protein [Polaromonas sp. YR568]SFU85773.1 molybdate transport system ATP-binding protein [Polaromonas sp. YR568]
MIDVDLQLSVTDGRRRFDLSVTFSTDAPFAALYGPSGSGKTLTLQAIAGLLHPAKGHIKIDGRTLYDSAAGIHMPSSQRRIGYLFQNYALFPHLSVRDNIGFGLTTWRRGMAEQDRARVQSLLGRFDLVAMADSRPATLSGGQQQRVALARALACEPQILLLDEPFASLNPMLRQSLRTELAEVRRQWGIPALMITHDVEDVLELADVAFVYQRGQIEKEVNLRTSESREFTRAELGVETVAETPLRQKLRRLLLGAVP